MLSDHLIHLLATAQRQVQDNDPTHYPTPQIRRAIYQALLPYGSARAWQGIFAARRVLPIVQTVVPDDDLPLQLITTAENVLYGSVSAAEAWEVKDMGYHAMNVWLRDDEYVLTNAGLAAYAAYRACTGVHGHGFLDDLDTTYTHRRSTETGDVIDERITGDRWTNKFVFEASWTDTVLTAAVVVARHPITLEWDYEKWREFWTWWVSDAIPAAAAKGRGHATP